MATVSMNHELIRTKLNYFIHTKKIPNIIFYGPCKSGKRTLLNEFLQNIYNNDWGKMKTHIMTVECCHGKGIKFIRDELKFFAKAHIQSNRGANFKSIVLLNADSLTIDAQSALRRCIELFSHNTRFFIVVENKERLLNPILSRFCEIYVSPITKTITDDGSREVPGDDGQPQDPDTLFRTIMQSAEADPTMQNARAIIQHAIDWCEKGFCAGDWVSALEKLAETSTTEVKTRMCYVVMCYYKFKPDFRCEKMLTFYVMYFTLMCSNADLENMLL